MKDTASQFHCQGFYVATPSGVLLASANIASEPQELIPVLQDGLAKWKRMSAERRLLPQLPEAKDGAIGAAGHELYPKDGLVLRATTRSLPHRSLRESDGTSHPKFYRLDHAWFRKDEAKSFLPEKFAAGAKHHVPKALIERLATYHLGTNVDGINGIRKETIKEAQLGVEVVSVDMNVATLRLEGACWTDGWSWTARGENVGYRCKLLGKATYDWQLEQFTSFELVAVGLRKFGKQEVPRGAPNPLPLGVVFRLAGHTTADRQPPKFWKDYGWK